MKHLIRIAALLVVIAGAARIQAANQDVDKAFRDLQYGDYPAAAATTLTKAEIFTARTQAGDTLTAGAIIAYPSAKAFLGATKAQKELKNFITHLAKNLTKQERSKLLNARNVMGQTALMFAAQQGLPEVAKQLHNLGALAVLKDHQGQQAADFTRFRGLQAQLKEWAYQEEKELAEIEKGFGEFNGG